MPDGLEELEGGAPGAGPSANVAASALPREPARRQKVVKVCAASICFMSVCVCVCVLCVREGDRKRERESVCVCVVYWYQLSNL